MDIDLFVWLSWFALFFVFEVPALFRARHGDTLSERVWIWLGRYEPFTVWVLMRRVVFGAFWLWLSLHFFVW
jgi:hypothetical protein